MSDTPSLSVYRRPRSRWWWYSLYIGGARHRGSCKSLGISIDTHTEQEARAILLDHFSDTNPQHTLGWVYNNIAARLEREGLRESTIRRYRESLAHLVDMLGASFFITDIQRRPHLDQFKQYLIGKGMSPSTVNSHCRMVQTILSRMVEAGIMDRNPFERFRKLMTPEPDMTAYTPEEIDAFFTTTRKAPAQDNVRIIRILYHTGRRSSEILELERDDVDLAAGAFQPMNAKRHDRRKKWLQIPDEVLEDFKYFMTKRSRKPFHVCTVNSLYHWFLRWRDKAKINPNKTIKHFRNTFVSEGLEADNAWAVKEYLDHSSIQLTESYHRRRLKITRTVKKSVPNV